MNILKVNYHNTRAGAFIAVPSTGELPNAPASFALVQICRLRQNGVVVLDPAADLDWEAAPGQPDQIKAATLDPNTGWFIDTGLEDQNDRIYYMDSFSAADKALQLTNLTAQGNDAGGVLYLNYGAQRGITGQTFAADYGPRTVVVGIEPPQYPMLLDSPQQPGGSVLDFEVHLVYRNNLVDNTQVVAISNGFRWTFTSGEQSTFDGFLNNPSNHFKQRMAAVVVFQNQSRHTTWVLF